jgi:capsular exopolysaccharide synthesis family protein
VRFDELRQRCAKPGWNLNARENVFSKRQPSTRCAEQFRTLRSRLGQLRGIQPIRTLLITSSVPGEGKTFVALNLAQAIACQHGQRALLIDADLRASRLHVGMGAPRIPGLADYLGGEGSEFSIMQSDLQESLFLIPAGSPVSSPAELLANKRMKNLLDRLGPVFDWIIVDAPPMLPVSDASVLEEQCDGVILVVRAGSTPFDLAQTASQEIQKKKLLGVVLNRAEESTGHPDYDTYFVESRERHEVVASLSVSSSSRSSHSVRR